MSKETVTASVEPIYFNAVNNGETTYKEWLAEKRQGHDVVVFVNFKTDFINQQLKGESIDDKYRTCHQFVLEVAREKEIGKFFHNMKGAAYGAALKYPDGRMEYKHEEYWINGKRVLDEKEIKKIIHDTNFKEKVETIING